MMLTAHGRIAAGQPERAGRGRCCIHSTARIDYDVAVLTMLLHRRRTFHSLSALALLAWLGLVMMGPVHAASMPMASAYASPAKATSGPAHPVLTATATATGMPVAGCGMTFGCHCGMSCFALAVSSAQPVAGIEGARETGAHVVQPVPAGMDDPPLHPPSY